MKHLLWLFLASILAARATAQSNGPVRLAIIAETTEASSVSDLLTAELSKNPQVILLERNEIDRVYREQGLSAANRDYLKLGQVLGADGVLLIASVTDTNQTAGPRASAESLRIQLIAVKPGVLLASERLPSPPDLSAWSSAVAKQLEPLLPKLSVLVKDAVPVSVVNFRSAIQSPETKEVERQLTMLAIERLSREPQLIVLERTKMQMLAAEKDLKGLNDSAFWNGSYLLDGTIDRDGYSPGKVTISARLVPPRGGAPVAIEVSGSRTNFPQVINQLAEKIRESLRLSGTAAPWNPADEAQKYYEEAQWALKWGLYEQAQSASDSAWALGKQDMDCALARLTAYIRPIPAIDPQWETSHIVNLAHPLPAIMETNRPDPLEIDQVLHVLQLYEQFGRTLSTNDPQQDSPYYITGLLALEKATGVLRHFHVHPESQAEVNEKLADLRAATRRVAAWIGRSPSVRKTYWVGEHVPSRGEFYNDFKDDLPTYSRLDLMRNFYQSELKWGRFWQEKPDDCVALYRSLMESPMFTAIHNDLWNMRKNSLVAWNAEDQKRIPALWQNFITELNNSTNAFLQMEGRMSDFIDAQINRKNADREFVINTNMSAGDMSKALTALHAERDSKMEAAWTNLFDFIFTHYDQIVTGREQLFFLGLGEDGLIPRDGEVIPALEKLYTEYRAVDGPKLTTLHDEYGSRFSERLKEIQGLPTFKQQKEFLAKFTPFDWGTFSKQFNTADFSREQAAELKPLLTAYQSNMVASVPSTNRELSFKASSDEMGTRSLGFRLDRILASKPAANPAAIATPALTAPPATVTQPPQPGVAPPKPTAPAPPAMPTNALIARKFLAFPINELPAKKIASLVVFSHRMRDDKLLLNLQYLDWWTEQWVNKDGGTNWQQFRIYREAGAVLEPNGTWTVTPFPHTNDSMVGSDFMIGTLGVQNVTGQQLYVEIFHDAIYVSDPDAIRHYDLRAKQWSELPFPGQERAQLYVVNDHLYAASSEGIWEILDDGKSSHILASIRRQPAVSSLDSRSTLGKPLLFSGKNHALWVALKGEVFAWDRTDWKPVLTVQDGLVAINSQGTIFFRAGRPEELGELWRLTPNETQAALCLRDGRATSRVMYKQAPTERGNNDPAPLWVSSRGTEMALNPLTLDSSTIYLLSVPPSASATRSSGTQRNGRRIEANLVCLLPDNREPVTIPIQFDANAGPVTVPDSRTRWAGLWVESSPSDLLIGATGLPGVWVLPKAGIQAEVDRQIQARRADIDNQRSALAKYDRNKNRIIDAEEKESAINDPAYLKSELKNIDANDNGLLEPGELSFFDVNKNGTLNPTEEEGVHIAQGLLAEADFKSFDANEDGKLDYQEIRRFIGDRYSGTFLNGAADVASVKRFLESTTEELLIGKSMPGGPNPIGNGTYPRWAQPPWKTTFKQKYEDYLAHQKALAAGEKP
jgi:curli biogenesis system outer membrane secretion channel CsgG